MILSKFIKFIKIIYDNTKNNNLSKEIAQKNSQLSKINDELHELHSNAINIYQDASNLILNFRNNVELFSFNYTKGHLIRYQELEKKKILYNTKKYVIALFFMYLFIIQPAISKGIFSNFDFESVQNPFNYDKIIYAKLICPVLLSMAITHLIAYILHVSVNHFSIKPKPGNSITKKIAQKQGLKVVFYFFLSPDLLYANYYKNNIKNTIFKHKNYQQYNVYNDKDGITPNQWNGIKIELKSCIQACNWVNVIISIGLAMFTIILIDYVKISEEYIQFLLCIIMFRILSRGIEVLVAFYKDIVSTDAKLFINRTAPNENAKFINGFKSSLLRQNSRLSLAIHTLLELFILYALAYYLLFNLLSLIGTSYFILDSPCETIKIVAPNFLEMFLFSSTLGIFNISYGIYQNVLLAILHFSQVILSAVLILISIAQYVSGDSSLTKEDEALFRNAALDDRIEGFIDKHYSDNDSYLK